MFTTLQVRLLTPSIRYASPTCIGHQMIIRGIMYDGGDCRRRFGTARPPPVSSLLAALQQRQLVFDITSPLIDKHLEYGSVAQTPIPHDPTTVSSTSTSWKGSVYCGYDPTAPSLHVGNLLTASILRHFQLAGWRPVVVLGGATGLVGDPSGRSTERPLLDHGVVADNTNRIGQSLATLFRSIDDAQPLPPPLIVNNIDWFNNMRVLDFLRSVGKNFTLAQLLGKHSIKSRASHGLSFTEFSYQLLQAADFLHLYQHHQCTVQIGGSDQWGNITSGIHLINRSSQSQQQQQQQHSPSEIEDDTDRVPLAYGLTIPLLTTAAGEKIGKSAGNATVCLHQSHHSFLLYCKCNDSGALCS
jgi:tyrosyl-tRNA synthetase